MVTRDGATKEISKSDYAKLITQIASIYEKARSRMVEAYWEIGKYVVRGEQGERATAEYGAHLLEQLSRDLMARYGKGFSVTNLRRMRRLYLLHPIQPPAAELTWTQYSELLALGNTTLYGTLQKRIAREKLSKREIRTLVSSFKERSEAQKIKRKASILARTDKPLALERGELYLYAVKELLIEGKKCALLDCGFSTYNEAILQKYAKLQAGDTVASIKKGRGYTLQKRARKEGEAKRFTYKAYIEKIIDGDTLWVYIPVGFEMGVRTKVRLNAIDAPEIATKSGRAAKRFLTRALQSCPFVIIKTYKPDKYDRYLADLFFLPGEPDAQKVARLGIFLNQELLNAGHAVRV
jgi:endonuclease YncB( thermonuclease family)